MKDAPGKKRDAPAGNWPPYVRACLRRSLLFRFLAAGVSALASIFFAVALWMAGRERVLLGIDRPEAALALVAQLGATVFLILDLVAAKREHQRL